MQNHPFQRVLAISAHPDDAEIGCGGTLAWHTDHGDEVHLLVVTDGRQGPGTHELRESEQRQAADVLGVHTVHWGGFEDAKVQLSQLELVHCIEAILREHGPFDVVYTHFTDDSHQDHRTVAVNSFGACRDVATVLQYRSPSSHDFSGHVYRSIDGYLDTKLKALACHGSQVQGSRRVDLDVIAARAIALGGECGRRSAESFIPYRMVL